MGHHGTGAAAARHRAQSFPEAVSADGGNYPAQQQLASDGDAVGARLHKPSIKPDLKKYYPTAGDDAHERVALYRLAWDVAGSAFAGRQVLYERFFFGEPVRMASALVDNTDLKPLTQRIKDFLNRTD